jgi:hypothetical protein
MVIESLASNSSLLELNTQCLPTAQLDRLSVCLIEPLKLARSLDHSHAVSRGLHGLRSCMRLQRILNNSSVDARTVVAFHSRITHRRPLAYNVCCSDPESVSSDRIRSLGAPIGFGQRTAIACTVRVPVARSTNSTSRTPRRRRSWRRQRQVIID